MPKCLYFFFAMFFFIIWKSRGAQNYGISDTASISYIIQNINIQGNNKTKSHIILRELTFKEGDTISLNQISQHIANSSDNLLNTPLFNYVTINHSSPQAGIVVFDIIVEERWYFWPSVHLNYADRNFSEWLRKKDVMRINYGFGVSKYNFRGRNEKIKFFASFGYKEYLSFYYHDIFLDRKKKHSVGMDILLLRQNEVPYNVFDNKEIAYKSTERYIYHFSKYALWYTYRPKHFVSHSISAYFLKTSINDSVYRLNHSFLYNNKTKQEYVELNYFLSVDYRDFKVYPLEGWFFQLHYSADGLNLGMFDNMNIHTLRIEYNKYIRMNGRWFWGAGLAGKITSTKTPFSIAEGLGYKTNALRGYEYYVVHGGQMFISNNYLKYAILPKKVKKVNFIPFEKFNKIHFSIYANLFFDFAHVSDVHNEYTNLGNSFTNEWLYSTGLGLDLVTYYDKVLRVDFSINHLKEPGIFIHFRAPF